jgi:glycerate kinase
LSIHSHLFSGMRILIAPDKFKGSIDAVRLCELMAATLQEILPEADIIQRPLADGGDGFASIMGHYFPVEKCSMYTMDALGNLIVASYSITEDRETAFVEMSVASGLALISQEDRNPEFTDTRGTGLLIKNALEQGVRHVVIGIGGSATNDGGMGMAQVLGYNFLDKNGLEVPPCGFFLRNLHRIIPPEEISFNKVRFTVACDVKNPLYGPDGAAHVFGPQKGADPEMVARLDAGLRNLDEVFKQTFGRSFAMLPGAGAAGGMGAGAMAFLGADMRSGFDLLSEMIGLEAEVAAADLIITGEGRLDGQSFQGKVVGEVLAMAKRYGKPVHALCGAIGQDLTQENRFCFGRIASLLDYAPSLSVAISEPERFIPPAVRSLM